MRLDVPLIVKCKARPFHRRDIELKDGGNTSPRRLCEMSIAVRAIRALALTPAMAVGFCPLIAYVVRNLP